MPSLNLLRAAAVPAFLLTLNASSAVAQVAVVRTSENFRSEPNGTILGVLEVGASLPVVSEGENWVEVILEGWVWIRSLQAADYSRFGLRVSAVEGENLRAEPQGTILARLRQGTLLEQVGERPGWSQVRRTGWPRRSSAISGRTGTSS